MIIEKEIEKAKNLIKNEKKPIMVKAVDDSFNRKILEYGRFDILISPESGARKNSLKNLNSGLNEVTAKISAKNRIAIGIDLKEIRE